MYREGFVMLVTNQINEGQPPCITIAGSKLLPALFYHAEIEAESTKESFMGHRL